VSGFKQLTLRVTLVPTLVPRYRFANATAAKIASSLRRETPKFARRETNARCLGRANPPAALAPPCNFSPPSPKGRRSSLRDALAFAFRTGLTTNN